VIESAEEFVRLRSSSDPAEYLRAAHESADESVWRNVIAHYPDFKEWVAHNKSVPMSILQTLAVDDSAKVRRCVAMKNCAGSELLGLLAKDEDSSVRQRVAFNKSTSTLLLQQLSDDRCELVAEAARTRLNMRAKP